MAEGAPEVPEGVPEAVRAQGPGAAAGAEGEVRGEAEGGGTEECASAVPARLW